MSCHKYVCVWVHQLFSWVGDTRHHYMLLAVVVGLMSVEGWSNLQRQWNIAGEYQNVPTEQLMDWINGNSSPRQCTAVSACRSISLVFTVIIVMNTSSTAFFWEPGRKIVSVSGDSQELSFLFPAHLNQSSLIYRSTAGSLSVTLIFLGIYIHHHHYCRHRRQAPWWSIAASTVCCHSLRSRACLHAVCRPMLSVYIQTLLLLLLRSWWRTLKSFTEWRIVSAGGHESAKVSLVVKFSLYQSFESCKAGEVWDYV